MRRAAYDQTARPPRGSQQYINWEVQVAQQAQRLEQAKLGAVRTDSDGGVSRTASGDSFRGFVNQASYRTLNRNDRTSYRSGAQGRSDADAGDYQHLHAGAGRSDTNAGDYQHLHAGARDGEAGGGSGSDGDYQDADYQTLNTCSSCNTELPPNSVFCNKCGARQ